MFFHRAVSWGSMVVLVEDDSSKEGHKTMLGQLSTETTSRGKVR